MRLLLSLLYAAAANGALAAGNNLVFQDDFESVSTQSPPPGWAMWGAAQYKVPANYWLYYYFNRHLGEWVLPTDGTAPYHQPQQPADRELFTGPLTPALVTQSGDGRTIYLVIANGSWSRAVPCHMRLRNFRAKQATGILLTSHQLDAKPLLERKEDAVSEFTVQLAVEDATCVIPPHAVVFVTLTR